MTHLSQFGRAYLKTLEQNRSELWRQLLVSGELHDHVAKVDARASAAYQELLVSLQKASAMPDSSEERAQMLGTIANQARELVMDEILVRDHETEIAEERGWYL